MSKIQQFLNIPERNNLEDLADFPKTIDILGVFRILNKTQSYEKNRGAVANMIMEKFSVLMAKKQPEEFINKTSVIKKLDHLVAEYKKISRSIGGTSVQHKQMRETYKKIKLTEVLNIFSNPSIKNEKHISVKSFVDLTSNGATSVHRDVPEEDST